MLRIKEAREARGWTQEQLAEAVNTTQQTIQRWETGQTDVKTSQIKAISKALGVTVSFILNCAETENKAETLSQDEIELLTLYRAMSTSQQNVTLALMKELAK